MHRPRFIDHRGKLILYLNLARASPRQHAVGLAQAEQAILKHPATSLLLLLDVTGAGVNHETDEIVARFVERTRERIRARAVVGASGLRRRAFDLPAHPDEHAFFDDLERARDWLVAQDDAPAA